MTLKEDNSHASPISSVFYEYYEDLDALKIRLASESEKIQCIVSANLIENSVEFGGTQKPALWDYADSIDTISFLIAH